MAVSKYSPFKDCPIVVKEYLDYTQTIKGKSVNTVDGYYIELRSFLRYIKLSQTTNKIDKELIQNTDIHDIPNEVIFSVSLTDIYSYLNFAKSQLGNSQSALSRKASALRGFYNYVCVRQRYSDNNPTINLEMPKNKKRLPRYLSLEQSKQLLDSTNQADSARIHCILTLFLNCGMRLSELVGINITDIKDDTIRIIGKGSKERLAYLNPACQAAIQAYLESTEGLRKDNALFINKKGTRISNRRVQQLVDEAFRAAGIDSSIYSPHKLRHTAATLLYQEGGADLMLIKEILGHESIATTEIYTHVGNNQIRQAVAASPLAEYAGNSHQTKTALEMKKPTDKKDD